MSLRIMKINIMITKCYTQHNNTSNDHTQHDNKKM
jgi:hypothetical protein